MKKLLMNIIKDERANGIVDALIVTAVFGVIATVAGTALQTGITEGDTSVVGKVTSGIGNLIDGWVTE